MPCVKMAAPASAAPLVTVDVVGAGIGVRVGMGAVVEEAFCPGSTEFDALGLAEQPARPTAAERRAARHNVTTVACERRGWDMTSSNR